MSVKRGSANISISSPAKNKRKTMVSSPQKKKQMDKARTLTTLAGPTKWTIPKKDGGSFTKTTVIVVEKNGNSFPFQHVIPPNSVYHQHCLFTTTHTGSPFTLSSSNGTLMNPMNVHEKNKVSGFLDPEEKPYSPYGQEANATRDLKVVPATTKSNVTFLYYSHTHNTQKCCTQEVKDLFLKHLVEIQDVTEVSGSLVMGVVHSVDEIESKTERTPVLCFELVGSTHRMTVKSFADFEMSTGDLFTGIELLNCVVVYRYLY